MPDNDEIAPEEAGQQAAQDGVNQDDMNSWYNDVIAPVLKQGAWYTGQTITTATGKGLFIYFLKVQMPILRCIPDVVLDALLEFAAERAYINAQHSYAYLTGGEAQEAPTWDQTAIEAVAKAGLGELIKLGTPGLKKFIDDKASAVLPSKQASEDAVDLIHGIISDAVGIGTIDIVESTTDALRQLRQEVATRLGFQVNGNEVEQQVVAAPGME